MKKLILITLIMTVAAISIAATGTVTTTVMTPRFLAYSTATQMKLNAKIDAANPVYSGALTSSSADGTHYVQPYNSVVFSGTPSTGMIQTNSSGIQYYNGSAWITPATDISSKVDVTRFTRYSSAHIGGGTTDITGKLDKTTFDTYTSTSRATKSYVDAAISGVTAGSLPQSASDTGKADGASWINTTTKELVTRIGSGIYSVAMTMKHTLAAILAWSPDTAIDFGSQALNSVTNAVTSITNIGDDIARDVRVTTAAPFSLYSTTLTGDIAAGSSRTVKLRFSPTAAGTFNGFVNYSAPNIAKVSKALSGVGVSVGASDNFTYSAGDLPTVSGNKWAKISGGYNINVSATGTVVRSTSGYQNVAYWISTDLTADHCSQVTVATWASGGSSPTVRTQTGTDSYYWITGSSLRRRNSGTDTNITTGGTGAITENAVGTIRKMCIKGAVITIFKDGNLEYTKTDPSPLSGGYAGMVELYSTDTLDNWVGSIAP